MSCTVMVECVGSTVGGTVIGMMRLLGHQMVAACLRKELKKTGLNFGSCFHQGAHRIRIPFQLVVSFQYLVAS